jgi:uncharacterized DUF497 family protein
MAYYFDFNPGKNVLLLAERGVCFEDIITLIREDKILDVIDHPNQEKYPGQKMYVIDIEGYCHLVPYVVNGREIFLKTIIPSRKATKKYLAEINERGANAKD